MLKNSSNHVIFDTTEVEYENELKKSCCNVDLKYTINKSEKAKNAKARHNMV